MVKALRLAHRCLVRQARPGLAVPYYDRMIDAIAVPYLGPFCPAVMRAFPGPTRILDAGAGTGQLALMLAQGNPQYTILAVDLSDACLRGGRRKALDHGVGDRLTFTLADLERCPIQSGCADLVVSTCSLHHWRHPARVLRELARVLVPAGEIWIMDDSADATEEARAEWLGLVQEVANTGLLFRTVFWFESRFLAYSENEVSRLCVEANLNLLDFVVTGVFFWARMAKPA